MQMREKAGKSRNTVCFQWFVAPEGWKVGSLKRRVRSQLARWEMKNCTPLWREAHFQVKMYKTHQVRTTFGSWDVEKVHAVVARSTFPSQNVQNTPGSDHFWKLRCRKSARRCGAKHVSKSKCTKHTSSGPLLEVEMSKKCMPLWREAHFKVKITKHTMYGPLLDVQISFRVAGARDCAPCPKWAKREGFVPFPKTMAGAGHLKRICKDAFSVAVAVQETSSFIGAVRRWGRWFPETGCILEQQIFRFAEMILRDRCSTSHDLASLFRGRRNTFDRWTGKIAKRIGTRLSALHSTFHFWRKSRRIALLLMLSSSKIEEVSQNCFVLDVVQFKTWGSLAELLRFWCCQLRKMRKSRRIASFLTLSSSNIEEVSENCFVFDVVKFKQWGTLAELLRFWCCQVQNVRTSRRIASFSSLQIDR